MIQKIKGSFRRYESKNFKIYVDDLKNGIKKINKNGSFDFLEILDEKEEAVFFASILALCEKFYNLRNNYEKHNNRNLQMEGNSLK